MKFNVAVLSIWMLLVSVILSSAKEMPTRPFFLETPVTLNGADVAPGMYSLVLEPHGSTVRVNLWKDGRFIATAQGVWVKGGVKYKENAVLLRVNSDGSRSVIEIRLAGTAETIVLNETTQILPVRAAQADCRRLSCSH